MIRDNVILVDYPQFQGYEFKTLQKWVADLVKYLQVSIKGMQDREFQIEDNTGWSDDWKPGLIHEQAPAFVLLVIDIDRMGNVLLPMHLEEVLEYCREKDVPVAKIWKSRINANYEPVVLHQVRCFHFFEASADKLINQLMIDKNSTFEKVYWKQVVEVGVWILNGARDEVAGQLEHNGITVYLAEARDDLTPTRQWMRRELMRQGFKVLPLMELPDRQPDLQEKVRGYLSESQLAILMVGYEYGEQLPGSDYSYNDLQNKILSQWVDELSNVEGEKAFSRKIIWFPPGYRPKEDKQDQFTVRLRKELSKLGNADVIDIGEEEISGYLLERANELAKNGRPSPKVEKNAVSLGSVEPSIIDTRCPFPGIRPYDESESDIFFGRESQVAEVIERLRESNFVAVTGISGAGKSSFVNAGVIPAYSQQVREKVGEKWRVIKIRPGANPYLNFARSLVDFRYPNDDENMSAIRVKSLITLITRHPDALTETLGMYGFDAKNGLFLVIDQFEELLKINKLSSGDAQDVTQVFVRQLVIAVRQQEIPFHLLITLRSDFIGDCSIYPDFLELLNEGSYFLNRLNRSEIRKVIMDTLAARQVNIDPVLLQELLKDTLLVSDQLPALQHVLRRLWGYWLQEGETSAPISLKAYQVVGAVGKSVNLHADEVYEELDEKDKRACEIIFKVLTESGMDDKALSRPATIQELSDIARLLPAEVIRVVEMFNKEGNEFLVISVNGPVKENAYVEIVHESFIRLWSRLQDWTYQEAISIQMYLQLCAQSAQYQAGRMGLLRPPDLQLALNWEMKHQPSLAWAIRYNSAFERAMLYLHTSATAWEEEELFNASRNRKAISKARMIATSLGLAAVFALGFMLYAQVLRRNAVKQKVHTERQLKLAGQDIEIIEQRSKELEEEKLQAILQAIETEREKLTILEQTRVLEQQKMQAEQAVEETELWAKEEVKEITLQKSILEVTAQQEAQQRTEAEKAKIEAFNRRMVTIAQNMAVKSLQLNDRTLKGLLAQQAYIFHQRHSGVEYNVDVFNGLLSAYKTLKGQAAQRLSGHTGSVKAIAFVPGRSIQYTTGADGRVLQWNVTESNPSSKVYYQHSAGILSLDISPDGRWLAVGTETSSVLLFDLRSASATPLPVNSHSGVVHAVCFSPDNRYLYSASADRTIRAWDFRTNTSTVLYTHASGLRSLDATGNVLVAGADDGQILISDRSGSQGFQVLSDEPGNGVYSVCFSPGGAILATGHIKGTLKVWDTRSRRLIRNIAAHGARIMAVKFSPDGEMIATASYDGTIKLYESRYLGNTPVTLSEHSSWVLSLAFSPDGRYLSSSGQRTELLLLWPARMKVVADQLCPLLTRDITQDEWNTHVATDVDYEKTCK
jgi:WD40 repeat protein